jgi:hypothetical protein
MSVITKRMIKQPVSRVSTMINSKRAALSVSSAATPGGQVTLGGQVVSGGVVAAGGGGVRGWRGVTRWLVVCVLVWCGWLLVFGGGSAWGVVRAPWWRLSVRPAPSFVPVSGQMKLILSATNMGDAATVGPITIKDVLPGSMRATKVFGHAELEAGSTFCVGEPSSETVPVCTYEKSVAPFERLEVEVTVNVSGAVSGEVDALSVSGGGIGGVEVVRGLRVSDGAVPFGVERMELVPEEGPESVGGGGSVDNGSGSTPFQLTSLVEFNQTLESYPGFVSLQGRGAVASSPALVRDLAFKLPPGLLGNVNGVAQCSQRDFSTLLTGNYNECPASSAIGVATVALTEPNNVGTGTRRVPVFNMVPAPGEPAQFGFEVERVQVILKTEISTSDYAVVVRTTNTTELGQVLSAQVTLWGEPSSEAHDNSRGWACLAPWRGAGECVTPEPGDRATVPFLRLPTSCEPLVMSAEGRSWPTMQAPEGLVLAQPPAPLAGEESAFVDELGGCEGLPFGPGFVLGLDQVSASTPSGMDAEISVPQKTSLTPGEPAESDVRSTTVVLPEGLLLNPAAADGLAACSEEQATLGLGGPAFCPEESKVGTVLIESPFLPKERGVVGEPFEKVSGGVYLAAQNANPFGSLLALYIIAQSPVSGVRVKLAGEIQLDPATGRIVSTFTNTPQLPFEHFKLHFFDGPRASLATPALCGTYTSSATFGSWSGKEVPRSSDFQVSDGAEGAGCQSPQPFAPSFSAGSDDVGAGAFTSFTLNLVRHDADQPISALTMTLPPGMAAILASVTPCPEPQATTGGCGPESMIGHAVSSAGLGPDPYSLPGTVYLTGPYENAPFGIEIVTAADAGPFHLGNVIVRSTINVDPYTAQVTINTSVPTMVSTLTHPDTGIPVQLKQTTVTVDRPSFEFNPTSCDPMSINGTIQGAAGASENITSRFQVENCQNLSFQPTLQASVDGHASKPNGTTFTVKVTSQGVGVANIKKVQLQLPIQLPSRLSTLQKACLAATFEANPASCDEGSVIGYATIHTPVFDNPLTGPAYLVSHGSAAFPDVEFVLQGENIKIILDGHTDIKNGITYSRFENTPDAPFTTFETVLPAGPHSILTANVPEAKQFNLCGEKLDMPTTITAQNNITIIQTTHITIENCTSKTGVQGSTTTHPTLKQQYTKTLHKCRTQYKHNKTKRATCEHHAHTHYLNKALHNCRKQHNTHKQKHCETTTRKQYTTHKH